MDDCATSWRIKFFIIYQCTRKFKKRLHNSYVRNCRCTCVGGRILVLCFNLFLDRVGIDRHRFGGIVRLVDTNQSISQFKHVRSQGDDNELSVPCSLFDVVAHYRNVFEVESGIDLVHDVEWRGLVVVESKNQRERRKSFLASRKIGDVLPRLFWRPHTEDDALTKWIEWVDQLKFRITSECDHLIQLLQFCSDDGESRHELAQTSLA